VVSWSQVCHLINWHNGPEYDHKLLYNSNVQHRTLMNPFLDTPQIEELIEFDYWDDEETKFEVESFYEYDDLTAGIDFSNTNDF
jgi:hypothetical protein